MRDIMGTGDHFILLSRRTDGTPIASIFAEASKPKFGEGDWVLFQNRRMQRPEALKTAKELNDKPELIEAELARELKERKGPKEKLRG